MLDESHRRAPTDTKEPAFERLLFFLLRVIRFLVDH